ncbi:ribonuclease R [Ammonifex thiophilus]|uniref:Ribonuclease R n=1 Tax=Ammonifex thiophilus TaxID=444093 RepID=A0A3D8P6V3_9THEO|nr:ribonuclease R [Ammonifex thiophilus]RDV84288.1 ribonuclease R [Ammonifex thiophilus]
MVTKKEILEFMKAKAYRPLTLNELARIFLPDGKGLGAFKRLLREMEEEGLIYQTRAARYGLPEQFNLVVGRLECHPRGYAFLVPDREGEPDVFIPPGCLGGAMHQDRVAVRLFPSSHGRTREGEVVRVLRRAHRQLVGTLYKKRRSVFVVPDDLRLTHQVVIPKGKLNGARNGEKVVVELTTYPGPHTPAEGRVVEVLGPEDAPGMDMLVLCRRYGLPDSFPPEVEEEAENVPLTIRPEELVGRRDLREWLIVTIDGEDAKDLDDAVSLELLPDGTYRLGVHIADVSYYVREGSALDREAFQRGTSIYLPDRVIPMLPPRLSNGICSLNPEEDRLTLSVLMRVDSKGEVLEYELFPSVIRSKARLTYRAVNDYLAGRGGVPAPLPGLGRMLELMQELCLCLRRRRLKQGAIDFNLPETKVVLDEEGRTVDVYPAERGIGEQIIEEFMLLANETVARHAAKLQLPFIYRIHPQPDPEKVASLEELLASLGYQNTRLGTLEPARFQEVLEAVAGKPEERLVNAVMLRSLKQARYAAERSEHFGLASEYYTHFTSPIRRYPDLFIHRVLRSWLEGANLSPKRRARLEKLAQEAAAQASERERLAMEVEREAVDIKKVAFMVDKVGREYAGFISGVTNWGLYVMLENTVEGLVHVRHLTDDFYFYDEKKYALVGRHTGKRWRLGDPVRVRVLRASVPEKLVEFSLLTEAEAAGKLSCV